MMAVGARSGRLLPLCLALICVGAVSEAVDKEEACYWAGPRVDCGYVGIAEAECVAQGCCWQPADFQGAPHVDTPWCFRPNNSPSEYKVLAVHEQGGGSLVAELQLKQAAQPELGADIQLAQLLVEGVSNDILRFQLADSSRHRWAPPPELFASDILAGKRPASSKGAAQQYKFSYAADPFSFSVSRADEKGGGPQRPLFDTSNLRLVFKDQYIELSTWVRGDAHLYGAGERASETLHLRRNGMPRPLWNRDAGPTFLEQNTYGSHPYVLALEPDGTAWGVFLLSSNAMDVVPTEDRLSFRVTGGIIDLYIFLGPTPLDVMEQYTRVVGRPAMMPRWSLGWHQCKYGYKSIWEVEAVVANYSDANLPLEAMWSDVDSMNRWLDFTFDPKKYPLAEFQRFVSRLHASGQRWVPIVDPGIGTYEGYEPYEEGMREGIFVKGPDGRPYLGWVWAGPTHFPDFLDPAGRAYFERQLGAHRRLVPWDGIWIDMDEVSNFCTGDVCEKRPDTPPTARPARRPRASRAEPPRQEKGLALRQEGDDPQWVCQLDCKAATGLNGTALGYSSPPYQIANGLQHLPLGTKAMSVLARHNDGTYEYDFHNLYGLSECKATADAVRSILRKRPFVLSRSSFSGSGAYSAHWTGDNAATWTDLAQSIPGVLSIGLFGIPMAGADICGFSGDTTEELCSRWLAMGAFYPFARSHSDLHGSYQEPYRWPLVERTARRVLELRYRLLPYLYSALRAAHTSGAPVMRPLWMNFPADAATHELDRQFMLGDALLVTPVLVPGADSVPGYFPAGRWYSLWDEASVVDTRAKGRTVRLDAPLGSVPLHMRGGTALAMHTHAGRTTGETSALPLTLVAALPVPVDESSGGLVGGGGSGRVEITTRIYHDDGEAPEVGNSLCHFLTAAVTVEHDAAAGRHRGEALLLFGSDPSPGGRPPQGRAQAAGRAELRRGHAAPGQRCAAVDDLAEAARLRSAGGKNGLGFEWPGLGGLTVLGWQRQLARARAEVVTRADACGGLTVLRSAELRVDQALDGRHLNLSLDALNHQLECPMGVRISWESAASAAEA